MVKINENFLTMKKNYLFIDIAKRLKAFTAANPDKPREENFASYNTDEAALLRRHIEMERKRHEANAKVEQEKVDWNRVKQYNSAILSMGEIKPDDEK